MDILRKVNANFDTGNQLPKPSKYGLLVRTRQLSEFEAPDKNFNIYSVTPVPSGDAAWVCCKNSRIVTLIDKDGTVLREVEYPGLVNGLDMALNTGNLWTSGAGGCMMELTQSGVPIRRFATGRTVLCFCVTQKNQVIVGMSGRLVLYDLTGNVILTSDFTGDKMVDTEFPVTRSTFACHPNLTGTGKTLTAMDVFLAAGTRSLKPEWKQKVHNADSSTFDKNAEAMIEQTPKNSPRKDFSETRLDEFEIVMKNDSVISDTMSELHTTLNTEKANVENNNCMENNSKKRSRPLVCTPHVVRECPITNNIAIVDLDRVIDGGNGHRPFILILNSLCKKECQCVFPNRYLINDLVYDSVGNIVVVDGFGSILLLSGTGMFLKKIFRPGDAMHSYVLGVDKKTNILWAVFKDSKDRSNMKLLKYCKGGHSARSWTLYSNSNIYVSTRM